MTRTDDSHLPSSTARLRAEVLTAEEVQSTAESGRIGENQGQGEAVEPEALSVGRIGGLRPRRRPGDGGEVPGADVDLVDALAAPARRTVAAWLLDKRSPATRQARLQVLASFLRWLRTVEPELEPLAVTGAHLDAYCEAALAGALTIGVRNPGKPLARATVARKRAVLSSFYTFAWRSGVVRHDRTPVSRPAPARDARTLTREDRRLLRLGIARLAAEGRPAEAAAVALLDATGAPATALAGLTLQDLRAVTAGEPAIVTVHDGRGDLVAFPVPPPARPLLRTLSAMRTAGEPLIRRADGRPVDVPWLRAALTAAALAGGIPRRRAELLDPHMMRATTVTELLRDQAT
ncbi:site-specific integrase [Nonomuraea candida]|uniref:site-specific integrase n=1 Tax=Nonomuraea candida TaxID=359159 RepID=UPI0005B8EF95|nr:site-specific integrase [Nonomuraea candida]